MADRLAAAPYWPFAIRHSLFLQARHFPFTNGTLMHAASGVAATKIKPFTNTVTTVPKCVGKTGRCVCVESLFHGRAAAGLSDRDEREHRRCGCRARAFRARPEQRQ